MKLEEQPRETCLAPPVDPLLAAAKNQVWLA